jgi:hypothetical protein
MPKSVDEDACGKPDKAKDVPLPLHLILTRPMIVLLPS